MSNHKNRELKGAEIRQLAEMCANRSQRYSLALNNYVQGNVKFLDNYGKFH